jgi:hypothetical protein
MFLLDPKLIILTNVTKIMLDQDIDLLTTKDTNNKREV